MSEKKQQRKDRPQQQPSAGSKKDQSRKSGYQDAPCNTNSGPIE